MTSKNGAPLRAQNASVNGQKGGRRYLPYVFTEQGVAMIPGSRL